MMTRTVAMLIGVSMLVAACGGGGTDSTPESAAPPLSLVVIGDSIASGEGINYGYVYKKGYFFNGWSGGTPDPVWQGEYQLCHDSAQAYGDA